MKNPHIFGNFIYFALQISELMIFHPRNPPTFYCREKNDKWPIYGHLVVLVNFVSKIGPFNLQ